MNSKARQRRAGKDCACSGERIEPYCRLRGPLPSHLPLPRHSTIIVYSLPCSTRMNCDCLSYPPPCPEARDGVFIGCLRPSERVSQRVFVGRPPPVSQKFPPDCRVTFKDSAFEQHSYTFAHSGGPTNLPLSNTPSLFVTVHHVLYFTPLRNAS